MSVLNLVQSRRNSRRRIALHHFLPFFFICVCSFGLEQSFPFFVFFSILVWVHPKSAWFSSSCQNMISSAPPSQVNNTVCSLYLTRFSFLISELTWPHLAEWHPEPVPCPHDKVFALLREGEFWGMLSCMMHSCLGTFVQGGPGVQNGRSTKVSPSCCPAITLTSLWRHPL